MPVESRTMNLARPIIRRRQAPLKGECCAECLRTGLVSVHPSGSHQVSRDNHDGTTPTGVALDEYAGIALGKPDQRIDGAVKQANVIAGSIFERDDFDRLNAQFSRVQSLESSVQAQHGGDGLSLQVEQMKWSAEDSVPVLMK